MKQIKCRVLVRKSGAVVGVTSKELGYYPDDASYSVELTGTLPEPGRWVKGEPEKPGEYWRWQLTPTTMRLAAHRRWWNGEEWMPSDQSFGPCVEAYAPYYWTGDDRPVEPPPEESERTCEVRWDDEAGVWRWHRERYLLASSGFHQLEACLRAAEYCGLRVTNKPREVVLQKRYDGFWQFKWVIPTTAPALLHIGKREALEGAAKRNGWRVLRVEPAPKEGVETCMDRGTPTTEDTCEVKWNGTHWIAATRRISWGQWGSLPEALAALDRAGFRVTNRAAALEGEKILKAEQKPTLGEMADRWDLERKTGIPKWSVLFDLVDRMVEAIGRDRR